MGCDIHAHFEVKINGEWHYYAQAGIQRKYALFARMANVRNRDGIEPISKPRGLPDDTTFMTNYHHSLLELDSHSHSWLSLKEIAILENEFNFIGPWWMIDESYCPSFGVFLFGNSFSSLLDYPRDYPDDLEDVRLVFWFDN